MEEKGLFLPVTPVHVRIHSFDDVTGQQNTGLHKADTFLSFKTHEGLLCQEKGVN